MRCRVIDTKSIAGMLGCEDLDYEPIIIYASKEDFCKPITDEEMANLEERPFRSCPSYDITGPGAAARTQWHVDILMNKRFGTDAQWAESELRSIVGAV